MKWLDRTVLTLLGPLLWVQGKYTRLKTPILPEASGNRFGLKGEGDVLRLLIVGDSAAAGVGATHMNEALPGRLVDKLSKDRSVFWSLLAQTGLDTQEILQLLKTSEQDQYDIAVLSAGVNDVKGLRKVDDWLQNINQVIAILSEKFGVGHVIVSPVPPMHVFSALPQPLRWYMGARAKGFNRHLSQLLASHQACSLLANDFPLRREFLAEDGFHPSPVTYDMWADEVRKEIDALTT